MIDYLVYSGKVALCLVAFFGFYRLFMGKETFHGWNRILLVGTSFLSFVLPLIHVPIRKVVPALNPSPFPDGGSVSPGENILASAAEPMFEPMPGSNPPSWLASLTWQDALGILLIAGSAFFLLRMLVSLTGVFRILRSGKAISRTEKFTVLLTDRNFQPFSWMRYIVLPREENDTYRELILRHEKAHVTLRHSYDRLAMDLMCVLQWFNPVIWLIRDELNALHECEADQMVLSQGTDIRDYQYLLVLKATEGKAFSVTNSLNHKNLKRRIDMMLKEESRPSDRWKSLFVLPVTALVLALGCKTVPVQERFVPDPLPPTQDTLVVQYDSGADRWYIEDGAAGFDLRPRYNDLDWEGLARSVDAALLAGPSVRKRHTAWVSFIVGADRKMSHANLYRSSGRREMDDMALRALDGLRYKGWQPARKNGKPTDVTVVFPVYFTPRISPAPRLLKDKYKHPLDTIRYVWNDDPTHRPYQLKGYLVDGVFHSDFKPDKNGLGFKGLDLGSAWLITDPQVKAQYGLGPEDGLMGITTKAYDAAHGRPREVIEEEKARSAPRDPRPARNVFLWVAQGGERLDSLPGFKGQGFDRFERWAHENGQRVRNADPRESGTVHVTFLVDKDGRVRSPHIVKGLSEAYDNAVLEFLLNCPTWEPAVKDGKPVPVVISCAICFNPMIR
ncbi:MAG: energy transducer TonB [Bacteroidales bacterium]|nr:energy transducer TonB [Bacteroidales bacterium]